MPHHEQAAVLAATLGELECILQASGVHPGEFPDLRRIV